MGICPFFSYKNASKYSNVVFVACSGGAIQKGNVFINKNIRYKYAANATLMLFGFDYMHIQNLRLYFSGNNLLYFTNYNGFTPEILGGLDRDIYPITATCRFGLNLTF